MTAAQNVSFVSCCILEILCLHLLHRRSNHSESHPIVITHSHCIYSDYLLEIIPEFGFFFTSGPVESKITNDINKSPLRSLNTNLNLNVAQ